MNDCCNHLDKCRFAVGNNVPGYLPEDHAEHFASYDNAFAAFVAMVEGELSDVESYLAHDAKGFESEEFETYRANIDVLAFPDLEFAIGGRVFWLQAMGAAQ